MKNFDFLRSQITREVFEDKDLHIAFRELSSAAQHSSISRWLLSQKIVKIRRGIYAFGNKYRKTPLSKFAIAARLYSPSYISFESALSQHGLIPEAVYATTSACFLPKKKCYDTQFGLFTYQPVPEHAFRLGVENLMEKSGAYLLADPLKALFDLVYAKRKKYRSISELEDDLRIDSTEITSLIKPHTFQDLEILAKAYKKRNCLDFFQMLMRKAK